MMKWNCQFKKLKEPITVGNRLILACDENNSIANPKPLTLKKELKIIFPDKKDQYRLKVLNTLYIENGHIDLEVTSYKPGKFSGPFVITDGVKKLQVENFSFEVQSVFTNSQNLTQKSHGPVGPFVPMPSYTYFAFLIFAVVLTVSVVAVLISNYFKRKALTKDIVKRSRGNLPSKIFIKNLRQTNKESSDYLKIMEQLFKTALENLFFIAAINKKPSQILKQLKKYERSIYKKYKLQIQQLLTEFESLQKFENRNQDILQVEKLCKNLVFDLEKEKQK